MKAIKVLAIIMLATFSYTAVSAQTMHRHIKHRKHHWHRKHPSR
jgi:hypothetical protein